MIKRELKANLKSFIVWTSIIIGLFIIVLITYPLVFTGENAEIANIPLAMFMNMMNQVLWANSGVGFTPYDCQDSKDAYMINGVGLTPFDVTGNVQKTDAGEILTA